MTLKPSFLQSLLDKLQLDVYFGYFRVHVKFDPCFTGKPEIRGRIKFLSSDSNFLAPFNSLNATIGKGVYFYKLSKPGLTLFRLDRLF